MLRLKIFFAYNPNKYAISKILLKSTILSLPKPTRHRIVQPFLLGELIRYFDQATPPPDDTVTDDSPITLGRAYLYAGGIVASVMVPVAIFHMYQLYLLQVGMKIRIGCCALIYQKVI